MKFLYVMPLMFLGACTLIPGGNQATKAFDTVIETGVEDRMSYNDKKAAVLSLALCDISIGAYGRMQDGDVKRGVGLICGTDQGSAVADDLKAAAAIMDALRGQ